MCDLKFCTREHATGVIIDLFDNFTAAMNELKEYERDDKKRGNYEPGYYEIARYNGTDWKTYYYQAFGFLGDD